MNLAMFYKAAGTKQSFDQGYRRFAAKSRRVAVILQNRFLIFARFLLGVFQNANDFLLRKNLTTQHRNAIMSSGLM